MERLKNIHIEKYGFTVQDVHKVSGASDELLKQKDMTQKEFSERTGIATTTISDWRKKNTNPLFAPGTL